MDKSNDMELTEYMMAFKDGYNTVFYSDNPEELSEPVVDCGSFASLGFYDGFQYGDYCYRVGTLNDVKPDNFVAEVDKRFTNAKKRHEEFISATAEKIITDYGRKKF